MKLIEADKVEQAIKDYWKAQVDKLPKPKNIEEHDEYVNRLDAILEHNDGLLKAIDELPSAEQEAPDINVGNIDTTTHDSIPAETGKNDEDRTRDDCISRQQAIDAVEKNACNTQRIMDAINNLPSAQPERKTGHWILDRSGAYCCSKCMEPCAGYVMMKPRDKFCKMCGAKMEDERKE